MQKIERRVPFEKRLRPVCILCLAVTMSVTSLGTVAQLNAAHGSGPWHCGGRFPLNDRTLP